MTEICFHGRGGQGVKTAALLLAEAAELKGDYIQGFADYGPERSGAPVKGYTRISDKPIVIHSFIEHPDVVVVLDESLIGVVPIVEGMSEDGIVIVNSTHSPKEIAKKLGVDKNLYVVDATGISIDELGRNIPNSPMLGAFSKVVGIVPLKAIEDIFEKKFKGRKKIIEGNVKAVKRAYEEVKTL
jgi:pyruvate ferredoxin oxidoreductase gamma subunit